MTDVKVFSENRKARHDYFILEECECGISLTGPEVKSIRQGKVNLKDAYCAIRGTEIFVLGMHITNYDEGSYNNTDPVRDRKLLLHKREIIKLGQDIKEKGLTLVPLTLYIPEFSNKLKLKIALAKGKHTYDKRASLKEKEAQRDIDRASKY